MNNPCFKFTACRICSIISLSSTPVISSSTMSASPSRFAPADRVLFMRVMARYIKVIHDPIVSSRVKKRAWKKFAEKYNLCAIKPRSAVDLKKFWIIKKQQFFDVILCDDIEEDVAGPMEEVTEPMEEVDISTMDLEALKSELEETRDHIEIRQYEQIREMQLYKKQVKLIEEQILLKELERN